MLAKKLKPLDAYYSSEAVDINPAGHIVGNSREVRPGVTFGAPPVSATLWVHGANSRIVKDNAHFEPYATEALRINPHGDVLCKRDSGGSETYFVWKGPASPSIDLSSNIPNLKEAIDLNKNGKVLVTLTTGTWGVYDLVSAQTTELPPAPSEDILKYSRPEALGIDNEGRVLAACYAKFGAEAQGAAKIHYLLSPTSNWKTVFSDGDVNGMPRLTKDGVALGTWLGSTADKAACCDLKKSHLKVEYAQDMIFLGGEGEMIVAAQRYGVDLAKIRPVFYILEHGWLGNFSNYIPLSWKSPIYAVGVSRNIVIGVAEIGGHTCGWRLDF
jgi:hypothetical protein